MDDNQKDEGNKSGIDKLQKDLYAREESPEIVSRNKALSGLGKRDVDEEFLNADETTPEFADVMGLRTKKRRNLLIGGAVIAAVLMILIVAYMAVAGYRNSRIVTVEDIGLTATAPQDVISGQEIRYKVQYANNSNVDWNNVEISFEAPKGFTLTDSSIELNRQGSKYFGLIGDLAAGQSDTIEINGSVIGEIETVALATFGMSVTPSNFTKSVLTKETQASTVIAAVPLEVSIEASEKASSGDRIRAIIRVRNVSDTTVNDAYLRLNPSVGTELAVEDPEFSDDFLPADATWELSSIDPLEEVERVVILYVEGKEGEHRPLGIEVGVRQDDSNFVQNKLNHLITMSTSELFVEQIYNGSNESQTVYPGDNIEGVIRYKNVGTIGLKNVIIEVAFEGTGFDPATLKLNSGSYDPRTRKITWSAASVPELATLLPQGEGEIKYSFSIAETGEFPTDTNTPGEGFTVVSVATIDSPDLPVPQGQAKKVVSSRHTLSVGTTLSLAADAFYDDGRLGIESYGPLPPEVGEETTYTLRFRLGSPLNEVGGTELKAVLPDGVRYTGRNYKTSGEIDYNERSGEVVWAVPLLDKLTGVAKPPQELHIQVSIVPGENQRGDTVTLMRSLAATGRDLFVDETVEAAVNQSLNTDNASPQNGRVQ